MADGSNWLLCSAVHNGHPLPHKGSDNWPPERPQRFETCPQSQFLLLGQAVAGIANCKRPLTEHCILSRVKRPDSFSQNRFEEAVMQRIQSDTKGNKPSHVSTYLIAIQLFSSGSRDH